MFFMNLDSKIYIAGQRAGELAVAFKLTQRTIERWLKQLKESDEIEFRGPPKTGGYFAK